MPGELGLGREWKVVLGLSKVGISPPPSLRLSTYDSASEETRTTSTGFRACGDQFLRTASLSRGRIIVKVIYLPLITRESCSFHSDFVYNSGTILATQLLFNGFPMLKLLTLMLLQTLINRTPSLSRTQGPFGINQW